MIATDDGAVSCRLLEELADSEHDRWSGWMRHVFGKSHMVLGWCIIPRPLVKCWMRQMDTSYCELSQLEKDSDRREANRTISIVTKHERAKKNGTA
jgi:hypothetical protein